MDEFLPTATLIGLIISFGNLLILAKNKQWDPAAKIIMAWAAGIGGVLLAAQTDYASQFSFGGISLDQANTWTAIFIGLSLGGSATVVNEFKKAFDNNDSAKKPPLLGPPAA